MDNIAILEYSFIFDPTETWSKGWEFEIDLVDFFTAKGYKAKVIETSGNSARRVLYVQRDLPQVPPIVNKEMTFKKADSSKPLEPKYVPAEEHKI